MKLRVWFAAAALGMAAPVEARWMRVDTDHFIIFGDMSENEAKAYAQRLELFSAFLRQAVGGESTGDIPIGKVTVYTVANLDAVRKLAGRNVGGFYNGDAQEFHAVVPRYIPPEYYISPEEILFHEYTHHVTLATTSEAYPSWLTEGIAEYFSTALVRADGSLQIGSPPADRGYDLLVTVAQMSVHDLLAADTQQAGKTDQEQKYARGWLLVHYLMTSKERSGQLSKYMALVRSGTDSVTAGEQAFGDLGKLTSEINVYARSKRFSAFTIPGGRLGIGPVAVRALSECQAAIMPMRIRSAIGVTEESAPSLVAPAREAAAKCPNDAYTQRVLAEIEFDAKNDSEASAAADRALAADPANLMAMTYKGRVLARQGKFPEARQWFIRANGVDSNHPLPFQLYYDGYVDAKQQPSKAAIAGLYRAVELAPRDTSLRLEAVRQHIIDDDRAAARLALLPLLIDGGDAQTGRVKKLLDDMKSGVPTKDLLAEMQAWSKPAS